MRHILDQIKRGTTPLNQTRNEWSNLRPQYASRTSFTQIRCLSNSRKPKINSEFINKLEALRTKTQNPAQDKLIKDFERSIIHRKKFVTGLQESNPSDIFANVELCLNDIDVFGFDYDYTLAIYTDRVQNFIYDKALEFMINNFKYPAELKQICKFDPHFAIRGLHYDTKKGNLLKLDYLGHIQQDAAYFGRHALTKEQLAQSYPSFSVQRKNIEDFRSLSDIYCLPEACLISDIIQYFVDHNIAFDPAYVFEDVMSAKDYVHAGVIHSDIIANLPSYLHMDKAIGDFLQKLRDAGKKLFLLTNSSYSFVDQGMTYLMKDRPGISHWSEMFDVIMASARKPMFYTRSRPFRIFNPSTGQLSWKRITELKKGEVYVQGSLEEFLRLTNWKNSKILYFGDHLFNDLVEPSRIEGWKTGVIIRELETEVKIQSTPEYRDALAELLEVENALNKFQMLTSNDPFIELLKEHRDSLRVYLKGIFNPNFGSVFRSHKHSTLFANYLQRYADVYTSSIANFLNIPLNYVFYPNRTFLPHEIKIPTATSHQH